MQRNINSLNESLVNATDGEIGRVKDVYFDDAAWAVRYLVVETGLAGPPQGSHLAILIGASDRRRPGHRRLADPRPG